MSCKKRSQSNPIPPDRMPSSRTRDLVVVTPPSVDFEEDYFRPLVVNVSDRDGNLRRLSFSSVNDEEEDIPNPGNSRENGVRKLSTSLSCGNIAERLSLESSAADKSYLQLPRHLGSSDSSPSSRDNRPTLTVDSTNKRSRSLHIKRNLLSRTRSSSPLFKKNRAGKTCSAESPTEGSKAAWARTVRFLSGKSASAPSATTLIQAQREFVWHSADRTGSAPDAQIASEVLDSAPSPFQLGANGMEASGVATHAAFPGSASGASSSGANGAMPGDVPDGAPLPNDAQREHLRQKIMKISEQIKIEQSFMDDNVAEYLKLSGNADKQQAARIKSVFEKKNQKSKATVAQLQKKLDTYHRRYKEQESNGSKVQGGGKYGLKEVGAKLTDFSGGVVGTVKQGILNSKLMNKKFGSVDNIVSTVKDDFAESEDFERSNSFGSVSAATSDSGEIPGEFQSNQRTKSLSPQRLASVRTQVAALEQRIGRVSELRLEQELLKNEMDKISMQVKRDISILTATVGELSYGNSRIESQLHDMSEMHLREMGDIKQDLASLEEKLMYHAQERARDMQEALESCQTRISKMEVQQQHTHQELDTLEGVDRATARALTGKLINLAVSVVAIVFVILSTVSSFVLPFVRSQRRALLTTVCVAVSALLYRNWESWTDYLLEAWLAR